MAEKPALHLEELNVKYGDEQSAKYAYRARVAGGWLIFTWTPGKGGLGGVTFYPDPDHAWTELYTPTYKTLRRQLLQRPDEEETRHVR